MSPHLALYQMTTILYLKKYILSRIQMNVAGQTTWFYLKGQAKDFHYLGKQKSEFLYGKSLNLNA